MSLEIIDFHTHPFLTKETNICQHKDFIEMDYKYTKDLYDDLKISKICGDVTGFEYKENESVWEYKTRLNSEALELEKLYKGFYIPGVSIHPNFVEESKKAIDLFKEKGFNLVGEIVPYHPFDAFSIKDNDNLDELLNYAEKLDMTVSFHTMDDDEMDMLVKKHKHLKFVAAHPGDYPKFMRHLERFKMCDNYYLDLSGTGIFRYGVVERAVKVMGKERVVFGSDYPICSPSVYLGGIVLNNNLTDDEKEHILYKNAKYLLKI